MRRLGLLIALCLAACAGPSSPTQLPPGQWGGDHVSLTVTTTGGNLEFDCAHGTIDEPPLLDDQGRFSLRGTYTREHGGPIDPSVPADIHPAQYAGQLQGSQVTLSVTLTDDGTQAGTFVAQLGQRPRLLKCL